MIFLISGGIVENLCESSPLVAHYSFDSAAQWCEDCVELFTRKLQTFERIKRL